MESDKFDSIIQDLKDSEAYNNIKTIESGQGAWIKIDGREKLNLCSNNYLGLASDPRLVKAVVQATKKYGVGTGSVRALSGTNVLHIELEQRLAKFKKAEAALVLQGGYMANLAAIQTVLGKEDIVISDKLNHASIIDAIRLAQVEKKYIYEHSDASDLKRVLEEIKKIRTQPKADGEMPVVLIITDGVFSMDGDLAPLPEIVDLAHEYKAMTMVDDAHGEGVLGDHGRGISDYYNLHGQIDIEVGTLSKAFGVIGGFITGRAGLIEYYKQKARQFLFSNSLSVPDTAALIASVKIMEASDEKVLKLRENTKYIKESLGKAGFNCGSSQTPITPVMLGEEGLASDFSRKLFEQGVYATPIKFPMVPKGIARIRVMPSAIHTKADLDFGIDAFTQVGKNLGVLK